MPKQQRRWYRSDLNLQYRARHQQELTARVGRGERRGMGEAGSSGSSGGSGGSGASLEALEPRLYLSSDPALGAYLLVGDANNDDMVGGADLIAAQQNFGAVEDGSATGLFIGDANDDGMVTGADLIAVQRHLGRAAAGPVVDDPGLAGGIVFRQEGELFFSGENDDYMLVEHNSDLAVANGSVALSFVADQVSGRHALFSKDAWGQDHGGHLTAFVQDGRVKVRLQKHGDGERWVKSEPGTIEAGRQHHVVVTFGDQGLWLYVDGLMADWELEYHQGIEPNPEPLAIGASIWGRSDDNPTYARNEFDGVISNFTLYNHQLSRPQVAELAGGLA